MDSAFEGVEYLAEAELRRLQTERWQRQAARVMAGSQFYKRLHKTGPWMDSLEALGELPFTDKEMIREDQRQHPPFGSYLGVDARLVSRVHRTSGTTGVAMNLALSRADAEITAAVGGRVQSAAGLGPGYRVVHCLNYQLWMGGYSDHTTLEATGATVIPFGVGHSRRLVRVIQELGINAISCTPSYPAVLEALIAEDFPGLKPRDLGLRLGLFGGEPGLDDPAFRERLEAVWGLVARNSNYGVSDVLCNFAGQTEYSNDLHFLGADVLYPELIDPVSLGRLPWQAGIAGELVLTHLAKECQPLVRFRTGDIIHVTATGVARCGRSTPRFRVIGRTDDMVVVRGINLFPTMVASVINSFSELSGEYRIVLAHAPPYDYLPVEAELAQGQVVSDALAGRIEAAIKKELGATSRVSLLGAGSLPRTEGKTRRVIRRYD